MTPLAPLMGPAGLAVARARHPAARSGRPDVRVLGRRLRTRERWRDAPEPDVAVAAIVARGTWGVDRSRFAALIGAAPAEVLALEAGDVGLAAVPVALLLADPFAEVLADLADLRHRGSVSSRRPTTRRQS